LGLGNRSGWEPVHCRHLVNASTTDLGNSQKEYAKRYDQYAGNVRDKGGVAPDIQTPDEALDLIIDALAQAG
jgi:enolase